jgi:hypothetical protein
MIGIISAHAGAFADDLAVLNNNVSDMRVQCTKIESYSRWGGLTVNVGKCQLQVILHGRARLDRDLSRGPGRKQAVPSCLDTTPQGSRAHPYQCTARLSSTKTPQIESYKYLGVHITLTLDWSDQIEHVRAEIKRRGQGILESLATPD